MFSLREMKEFKREFWVGDINGIRGIGKKRILFNKDESDALREYAQKKQLSITPDTSSIASTVPGMLWGLYDVGMVDSRKDHRLELHMEEAHLLHAVLAITEGVILKQKFVFEGTLNS